MSQDLSGQISEAIKKTRLWATEGWPMTFGNQGEVVGCLKEAQNKPDTFVNKQEAVAFWNQVDLIAQDVVEWGEKTLNAVQKGDKKAVLDNAYFTQFLAKSFESYTTLWSDLYKNIQENI